MVMPELRHRWTYEEIRNLPEDGNRYEVLDGDLFVTPAPSLRHQAAVVRLSHLLADYLDREGVGCALVAPADIVFSQQRAVQPDIFVLPLVGGRRPDTFDQVERLLLAVEVLSPSTARADRVVKRAIFREERVDEYWIVDLDARVIERSRPDDPRPELLDRHLRWQPQGAQTVLEIDVTAYFAAVLDA